MAAEAWLATCPPGPIVPTSEVLSVVVEAIDDLAEVVDVGVERAPPRPPAVVFRPHHRGNQGTDRQWEIVMRRDYDSRLLGVTLSACPQRSPVNDDALRAAIAIERWKPLAPLESFGHLKSSRAVDSQALVIGEHRLCPCLAPDAHDVPRVNCAVVDREREGRLDLMEDRTREVEKEDRPPESGTDDGGAGGA